VHINPPNALCDVVGCFAPSAYVGRYRLRKRIAIVTVALAGAIAAAGLLAVVAAKPAAALPSYKSSCAYCHSVAPVGTVSAAPSTTTPAAGATYTVSVSVDLGATGKAGYWIVNNDAATPNPNLAGGPDASPLIATMTAPTAPGTYTYKVFGTKGTPSAGQTATTTFSIAVAGDGGGGTTDTVRPTAVAPSAARVVRGKVATLRYRVNDAAPNLGTATATIKIKNRKGKLVKTLKLAAKPVNTLQKAKFKCRLAKGKYRFYVSAVDAAGNRCTRAARNVLTVK
jgi:hypothetical protein